MAGASRRPPSVRRLPDGSAELRICLPDEEHAYAGIELLTPEEDAQLDVLGGLEAVRFVKERPWVELLWAIERLDQWLSSALRVTAADFDRWPSIRRELGLDELAHDPAHAREMTDRQRLAYVAHLVAWIAAEWGLEIDLKGRVAPPVADDKATGMVLRGLDAIVERTGRRSASSDGQE